MTDAFARPQQLTRVSAQADSAQRHPIEFISPRWEPHVLSNTGAIDRPFYELCALSTLRDRLRAGDVWVAGSRQYRAFDEYLLPQPDWQEIREAGPVPVAIETTCTYVSRRAARQCRSRDEEGRRPACEQPVAIVHGSSAGRQARLAAQYRRSTPV
jgi:hypothetical protein